MAGVDLFDRPATSDDGRRNELDRYFTPAWMTASLLYHQPIRGPILEPCAGDGAIARVLSQAGLEVLTNDIDVRQPTAMHGDATNPEFWSNPILAGVDWVVSNLPFNVAYRVLEQAWNGAEVGVAMLLRKTFLEPTRERGDWLSVHPPDRIIGLPRHNFRGKGSDSVSTDWCIWIKPEYRSLFTSLPAIVIDHQAKTRSVA